MFALAEPCLPVFAVEYSATLQGKPLITTWPPFLIAPTEMGVQPSAPAHDTDGTKRASGNNEHPNFFKERARRSFVARNAADSATRYAPASAPSNSSSDILNRLRVVAATGEAPQKTTPRRKVDGRRGCRAYRCSKRGQKPDWLRHQPRSMLAHRLASKQCSRNAGATSGAGTRHQVWPSPARRHCTPRAPQKRTHKHTWSTKTALLSPWRPRGRARARFSPKILPDGMEGRLKIWHSRLQRRTHR